MSAGADSCSVLRHADELAAGEVTVRVECVESRVDPVDGVDDVEQQPRLLGDGQQLEVLRPKLEHGQELLRAPALSAALAGPRHSLSSLGAAGVGSMDGSMSGARLAISLPSKAFRTRSAAGGRD